MSQSLLRHTLASLLLLSASMMLQAQNPFDLTVEAWRCIERQQPDSAIMLQRQAISIFQREQGKRHSQVGVALRQLAQMYEALERPHEAIPYMLQALEIEAEGFEGEESSDYRSMAGDLARLYDQDHQYKKAMQWGERALKLYEDAFPPRPREIGTVQSNLTWIYADAGDYARAINMCHRAVDSWSEELGEDHPYIAILMNNLAGYHAQLGDFEEAIHYDQRSMDVVMSYSDTPDTVYAAALSNMAEHLACAGYNTRSIEASLRAVELRRQLQGPTHPKYLKALSDLAATYASIGENEEALRLLQQVVEVREQTHQTDGLPYVRSLANLAIIMAKNGDYDRALDLTQRAINADRKLGGGEEPWLLGNLGLFFGNNGYYNRAIETGHEALKLILKTKGKKSVYYARQLNDLGVWYEKVGDLKRAIKCDQQAIDLYGQLYGPNNSCDLTTRNNLAQLYASQQRYAEALSTLTPAAEQAAAIMLRNFTGLSAQQRNHYWNKYSGFLTHLLPLYTLHSGRTNATAQLYNLSALFAKSLLLNTELEMTRLIFESGDQQLVDDYYQLQSMKAELEKQRAQPAAQRTADADSLQLDISRREAALAQASKAYGDYCRNLTVTWEEVRNQLQDTDIAIEFLAFTDDTTQSYIALTLRPDFTEPHLIRICTAEDLQALNVSAYYRNTPEQNVQLCRAVWQPLANELQGVRRVFFSPAGLFYQVGIEQLPWDSVSIAADHYDFYRLSSTRELCTRNGGTEGAGLQRAVLYGGLAYDIILDDTAAPTSPTPSASERQEDDVVSRGIVKTLRRHLFSYLKNTQLEVDAISETLGSHNVDCLVFTNEEGTEQTLKQLSGQHYDLLHVATHGQYVPADQAEQMKQDLNLHFLQTADDNEQMLVEDFSLSHSLLAMSGANTLLNRIAAQSAQPSANNADHASLGDGVLTASEISRIDLRGMQLVVLSACQTGLGDVTNEGVMGLQRGFKKAGARTILMSLWPVNDRATAQLMETFYQHLMAGETKRKAFLAAQSDLRQRYAQNPHAEQLWGAFILLDAME